MMAKCNVHGREWYYEEAGAGDVLVLLHGFPMDGRIWEGQLRGLSDRYRVIVPDLLGFGRSGECGPFTMESMADGLKGFLEELKAEPCVMVGLSMGGYVALAFSQRYPMSLKGLVLVDSKAEAETSAGKEAREKMIDLVRQAGAKGIADQMLPKMFAAKTIWRRPEVVEKLRRIMEKCPAKTIEYALEAMRDREDRTCYLPSVAVPGLVIVGDEDAMIPVALAEMTARTMPRGKVVVIREAGHVSPMEQPEQVNEALGQLQQ